MDRVVVRAVSKKEHGTFCIVQTPEEEDGMFSVGGESFNMKLSASADVAEGEEIDLSGFVVTKEAPSMEFWTNADGERIRNRPWLRLSKA